MNIRTNLTLEELFAWYTDSLRERLIGPHIVLPEEEELFRLLQNYPDGEKIEELLFMVLADWEEYGFRGGFTLARELLLAK